MISGKGEREGKLVNMMMGAGVPQIGFPITRMATGSDAKFAKFETATDCILAKPRNKEIIFFI